MLNLLKTDLKRVVKDKLFMVAGIIGAVFAVITPLLYWALFQDFDREDAALLGVAIDGKGIFFGSFSTGNNFGLIVPVLLAIILCKDASHGTVRNKIISGKTRTQIYFSMYVTCVIVLFGMVLLHALVSMGFSLLFFPYQDGGVALSDLWYFLGSVGLQLLVYLFMAALICRLCVASRNVGLVIVKYVAIVFAITMVASILMISIEILKYDPDQEKLVKFLEVVQNVNIFNFSAVIGGGDSYTAEQLWYLICSPAAFTALLIFLGCRKMNKKDIK